jgi:hypothetical protein
MKPKECFWSGLKGGIFEQKHFRAMGNALWLFGWLCMRQSQINESGDGLPHYGNPLTFKEISDDTGFSRRTIEKWAAVLSRTGYIHTKRIGNSGAIFFIHKAKSKAKNSNRSDGMQMHSTSNAIAEPQVPANGRTPKQQVPANEGGRPRPLEYTQADKSVDFQNDAPITNTLNSKSLSNYNTDAASPEIHSLMRKAARELQPPRQSSEAELDERRRLLLKQSEEMLRRFPRTVPERQATA